MSSDPTLSVIQYLVIDEKYVKIGRVWGASKLKDNDVLEGRIPMTCIDKVFMLNISPLSQMKVLKRQMIYCSWNPRARMLTGKIKVTKDMLSLVFHIWSRISLFTSQQQFPSCFMFLFTSVFICCFAVYTLHTGHLLKLEIKRKMFWRQHLFSLQP